MVDSPGHSALLLLMLALAARPLSRIWDSPLRYRPLTLFGLRWRISPKPLSQAAPSQSSPSLGDPKS